MLNKKSNKYKELYEETNLLGENVLNEKIESLINLSGKLTEITLKSVITTKLERISIILPIINKKIKQYEEILNKDQENYNKAKSELDHKLLQLKVFTIYYQRHKEMFNNITNKNSKVKRMLSPV